MEQQEEEGESIVGKVLKEGVVPNLNSTGRNKEDLCRVKSLLRRGVDR